MRNKQGNLYRAERKIRHYYKQEWCGYLTPSEAIALIDDGARPIDNTLYLRQYIQARKDNGESRPGWFYFFPSKEQMKCWGNQ